MTEPSETDPQAVALAAAELANSGRRADAIALLVAETGVSEDTAGRMLDAATAERPDDLPEDVIAAAEAGRRIEAIKLLRETRSMSLREAKDLLDARCPAPRGSGCASVPALTAAAALVACLTLTCLALVGCVAPSGPTDSGRTTGPDATPTLWIATYNIRHGVGTDDVLDLDRTAAAIAALDADIVALQEVDERTRRCGGVDQAAWLGTTLGMHHASGSFMDYDGGRYGMAILSRWPIESVDVWRLPTGNEPRVALAIDVSPPGLGPMTIVNVHFDWVEDDGFRYAQAEEVARRLRELDRPWILLGDFNDTPGSRTRELFASLGREGRKPAASTGTWPAAIPNVDIDSLVAGPAEAWSAFEARVVAETVASDHRPVAASVTAAD